jgi:heme A synthase
MPEHALFAGFLIVVGFIYLLPSIVAFARKSEYRWVILIANVLLGLTGFSGLPV